MFFLFFTQFFDRIDKDFQLMRKKAKDKAKANMTKGIKDAIK